uniref:Uncharacterized protein n=1 Tax=Fagus sylvatica TaxID=28930 RepID=A0A2N9FXK3_FAGSY
MAKKKTQGKLAKYVNTPEAMAIFRRHYGVLDDVYLEYKFWENAILGEPGDLIIPLVAIIEGGVHFPMDPLLANFLNYFNLSPTQISPNVFRIVMGMVELNRRLGLNLTVYDIIVSYTLRTSQSEAYSLRPRDIYNTLVNSLPDTNKDMTDDYLLVRGVWHHPNYWCSTGDGRPAEEWKKPQSHLTNLAALQIVYDSKLRTKRPHERKLRTKPLLFMISGTCLGSTSSASFLHPASKRRRLDPLRLETFAKGNGRAPLRGRLLVRSPHLIRETPEQKALRAGAPSYEMFGDLVRSDVTVLKTGGAGSNTTSALSEVARLPADMAVWKQSTNQEVIDNLRRGLMMGSLELEDRYQTQVAHLENSLKVATRSFDLKKEIERYKEQVRVAVLKRDEAVLQREESKESLRAALEANSQAEERIKALEAEVAEKEKAAFAWGRVEAETIMMNQLPDIYNEAFLVGWKALFAWPETEEIPLQPFRESLPYPDAPIGVSEEEV